MANDNEFVEQRMNSLKDEGFKPSAARARAQLRTRAAAASRRWEWTAAATAVAVLVLLIGLPSGRAVALNSGPSFVSMHEALLHFHDAIYEQFRLWTGAPPIRTLAYDFELKDSSGRTVKLSDYRGKVVLLNFWATWCTPCKAEVPWFVDLQKEFDGELVVLGVSFDEDGWKAVKPFIDQRHVNYPVMLASPDMPSEYQKIESLPTTFLIDRRGRVAGKHTALASKALYEEWIKKVI